MTSYSNHIKRITTSHNLAIGLVLLAGFGATLLYSYTSSRNITNRTTQTLNATIEDVQLALQKNLIAHEEILRGGSGLFYTQNNQVSREDWKRFIASYRVNSRYPGILGVGYVPLLTTQELSSFVKSQQTLYGQDYQLRPESTESLHAPITLLEPSTATNKNAPGYDLYTDPIRAAAMRQAIETGSPVLSGAVELVQPSASKPDIGVLYFMPIYDGTVAPTTTEERKQTIHGFVYTPLKMQELFEGVIDPEVIQHLNVTVYDRLAADGSTPIYQSITHQHRPNSPTATGSINLSNQRWLISIEASPDILAIDMLEQPDFVLATGSIITLSLAALLLYIVRTRNREFQYQRQLEVQTAKDELLSLASHQLRTPATGVKQYIGILLEGYAGEISNQHRELLEKAYVSNERQLDIINQILHVTRLETGRLQLRKRPVDIVAMIRDVLEEQKDSVKSRRIKLTKNLSRKPIIANVDEQYLRMVLENMINNAIKYTHVGGKVGVKAYRHANGVTIEIKDTGVGISEEEMPKLYQKFSRIDNELSIEAGGSGIGLYLSKEIIDLHGGTIDVTSAPNQGTEFSINLPK